MEDTIVKVEHLSHRYSIQWAVRDVSFEIPKHGIYRVVGCEWSGEVDRDEYHVRGIETDRGGRDYRGCEHEAGHDCR